MDKEIAIIDSNVLCALGLKTILESLIPTASIRRFATFAEMEACGAERYAHYFVAEQIYFEHAAFFLPRKPKTIIMANGDRQKPPAGIPVLNVAQPEDMLIQQIVELHRHGQDYHHHASNAPSGTLTAREAEVLVLLAKGCINKEIADRLNISQTTVITHRKKIIEKLGIRSVSGLTVYAVMHGYIEAGSI